MIFFFKSEQDKEGVCKTPAVDPRNYQMNCPIKF